MSKLSLQLNRLVQDKLSMMVCYLHIDRKDKDVYPETSHFWILSQGFPQLGLETKVPALRCQWSHDLSSAACAV